MIGCRLASIVLGALAGIVVAPASLSHATDPLSASWSGAVDRDERLVELADRVASVLRKHGGWGRAEPPLIQAVREGILASPLEIADGSIDSIVGHLRLHIPDDAGPQTVHGPLSDRFRNVRAIGNEAGTSDEYVQMMARSCGIDIAGQIAVAATFPPPALDRREEIRAAATREVELAYECLQAALDATASGAAYQSVIESWRQTAMSTLVDMHGHPLNIRLMNGMTRGDLDDVSDESKSKRYENYIDELSRVGESSGGLDRQHQLFQKYPDRAIPPAGKNGTLWREVESLNRAINDVIAKTLPVHTKPSLVRKAVRWSFAEKAKTLFDEAAKQRTLDYRYGLGMPIHGDWRDEQMFLRLRNFEQLLQAGGIQWLDGIVVVPAEPGTPLDEDEPVIRP